MPHETTLFQSSIRSATLVIQTLASSHMKNARHVQRDTLEGMSLAFDSRQLCSSPLSRIASADPNFEQERLSLEETEKLKSIRVMDWINTDISTEHSPTNVPPSCIEPSCPPPPNPRHLEQRSALSLLRWWFCLPAGMHKS